MKNETFLLKGKTVTGYEITLGKINLVFASTDSGLIACGAFDVAALDKFDYPAAKARGKSGSIKTIQDLLDGEIILVNETAKKLGISEKMSGNEALERI